MSSTDCCGVMLSMPRCLQHNNVMASSAAWLWLLIFADMMHGCTAVDRRHVTAVIHGGMTELLLL